MKKILAILIAALFVLPMAFATSTGTGIGVEIDTEDFEPRVWLCDHRLVTDDNVQWGRNTAGGAEMLERNNNYAFEGEAIHWLVLVMDKNGVPEKLEDVFATIGDVQGAGNDIEVNCEYVGGLNTTFEGEDDIFDSCNARIDEEDVVWNGELMGYYDCTLTVETSDSMYGEYWVTVEAVDLDGLSGVMDENEYWFFNPIIDLAIQGDLVFSNVRPGTDSYSETLLVGNDADDGSGVILDMFISGTDFYDSASSGAMCPTTNELALSSFRYFATNGAYSTQFDSMVDNTFYDTWTQRDVDAEGYVNIQYGDHWDRTVYDEAEIIQSFEKTGPTDLYYAGNMLTPGSEMAVTFKLSLPEPCNGDFDTGSIYFWGEAV